MSPARLTRAQYRVVPFQRSDTFTVLIDRATTATPAGGPVVMLAHGRGGAGKSRLAAEAASASAVPVGQEESCTEAIWRGSTCNGSAG